MVETTWYLGSEAALKLDQELMGPDIGYSLDQLMELAGLACAQATHDYATSKSLGKRVLTICGPGSK